MDGLVIGLGATGIALAGARMMLAFIANINIGKFQEVVHKLLSAGEREKALKLTGAVPKAAYGLVSRRLLEASRTLSADDGRDLVASSLRDTVGTATAEAMAPLFRWRVLGWLAAALAIAASVIGHLYETALAPSLILPAVVALGIYAGWRNTNKIARDCLRCGDELAGWLTDYVIEGTVD